MKKALSVLLCAAMLCTMLMIPSMADAAAWDTQLYDAEIERDGGSILLGTDQSHVVNRIDLSRRIRDTSTCTQGPVAVYAVDAFGEETLCAHFCFDRDDPGVLVPYSASDRIELLTADTFVLRAESGMLYDDVGSESFTPQEFYHGVPEHKFYAYIPLPSNPVLDLSEADGEIVDEASIRLSTSYGWLYPAIFDSIDTDALIRVEIRIATYDPLGEIETIELTAVPQSFDPETGYIHVRFQNKNGGYGVNIHQLMFCFGSTDSFGEGIYAFSIELPRRLLRCGEVESDYLETDFLTVHNCPVRKSVIPLKETILYERTWATVFAGMYITVSGFPVFYRSWKALGGKPMHVAHEAFHLFNIKLFTPRFYYELWDELLHDLLNT